MTTTAIGAPTHLLLADIELQENCRLAVVEDDKLLELAASIREVGVLQSLLVEPRRGGWALVAGYRRARAAEIAGVTTVPVAAIAPDLDPQMVNLVENLHRVDLSPIEKGNALVRMERDSGKSQRQLAAETGWSQGTVSRFMALVTRLHPDVQEALHARRITTERAYDMLDMPHDVQLRMLATGPAPKRKRTGRPSQAEQALRDALAAFTRGEEDAALVSARQAVFELERRQRDGRTSTPRQAPAPTETRDRAERRAIARASTTTAATGKVPQPAPTPTATRARQPGPARDTARTRETTGALPRPVAAPMPPAGQLHHAQADTLDDDVPPGRPKVRCSDCKQWCTVHVGSTSRKRILAHRELTGCDVTQQLKALPK